MAKKILYIITKSNFGGAQRYVYDLATSIPKNRYNVTVALGGTGERNAKTGLLKNMLEEKDIKVIPVTHFLRDMSPIQDVYAFFELYKIICKEKPDILHVMSSKAGGLGALAGRITGIPIILFTSHGLAYDEKWRPLWQRTLIWIASWWTFALATKTIQLTNDTYSRAKNMPCMKNKMALIHNGRTPPVFFRKEEARKTLCVTENVCGELWVGSIAELTHNKNLEVLIHALTDVHKRTQRKPHLWIIGEGEERKNLEEKATDLGFRSFLHLPGYVSNASQYLQAFDIFVLPSKKEGLPYVLLEAGLASLPVVVSNLPSIQDIIQDKETGRITETTPEKLSEVLEQLLEDVSLRKKYGLALKKHVEKEFSIEKMIHDTTNLYEGH
jgi:glycosyltransferase involved in cell wall biosynthesis